MDPSKHIDLAGMTLIVEDIRVNATTPGQAGEELPGNSEDPNFDSVETDELTLAGGSSDVVITGVTAAAGTGAGSAGHTDGAVATHVLTISVGGTPYYIPLCNTNA